jgi:hypothetical protein
MRYSFEWHPRGWSILGGFYPRVWGIGIHLEVGSFEQELQISLGPFSILFSRYS